MRNSLMTVLLVVCPAFQVLAQDSAVPVSSSGPAEADASSYEDKNWRVNSSITYETGDFGTDTTTNLVYIPVTIKRILERGDISFTVPYIFLESGPGVTALGGRPFRTGGAGGASRSDSGIGDMVLKGSFYLLEESKGDPFSLSPVGKIKFPTADEDEGLGSGEFDETIGFESGKMLNEQWSLYLDMGYTFIGDPPGTNLDNEFAVSFGPGYRFSEKTSMEILYEERTALVDGRPNPRDLVLGINHQVDPVTKMLGGLTVGLSNGSPDVGVTAGLSVKF